MTYGNSRAEMRDFRWERQLHVALGLAATFAVVQSGDQFQSAFGKSAEEIWEAASIGMAVAGVLLRIATLGFVYTDQTPTLRTKGLHSVLRYPVLLSDLLIAASFAVGTQVWWFIAACFFGFPFYYVMAVRLRDQQMSHAVGAIAAWWRTETSPAFVADFGKWNTEGVTFSITTGLLRSIPSVLTCSVLITFLEVIHDVRVGDASAQFWPADWACYFGFIGAAAILQCLYILTLGRSGADAG